MRKLTKWATTRTASKTIQRVSTETSVGDAAMTGFAGVLLGAVGLAIGAVVTRQLGVFAGAVALFALAFRVAPRV